MINFRNRTHPHVTARLASVSMALLMGVLLAQGCAKKPDYPLCESDEHCQLDGQGGVRQEYCVRGTCQQCASDKHCAAGQMCNAGRCEMPCKSDGECGNGRMCEGKMCVAVQCTDDASCGAGKSCASGRCKLAAASAVDSGVGAPCATTGRINFEYDSSDVTESSSKALSEMARCMEKNAVWKLLVEGHADERGTTDYNLQLGERRAVSVRDYLVRLGVARERMRTVSYGEEQPVETAQTDAAFAANRRAELKVQ